MPAVRSLLDTDTVRGAACQAEALYTAPLVQFLAPIRSATAGRALTRRPFVDRVGNRRVTDDFVSPQLSPQLWGGYPKSIQTL